MDNLIEELTVTSRGQSVSVRLDELAKGVLEKALYHGLTQKISDAAAGAKAYAEEHGGTKEEATAVLMDKAVRNLKENGWSARTIGTPGDPLVKFKRQIVKALMEQPQNEAQLAEWKAQPTPKAKMEFLDSLHEGKDKIAARAKELAEEERARREGLAGMDIDL